MTRSSHSIGRGLGSSSESNSAVLASCPTDSLGEWSHPQRKTPLALLSATALAIAWIIFSYRDTALAMEAIWSRSGTFAHGYLVAPISMWLVWRQKAALQAILLQPSLYGLLVGTVCGFVWLVAQLASVDSVAQLALVGMVISTVWALLGTECVRLLAFPLGFLFFSVPFGEFLFPSMMDLTTEFVVHALRFTGVPVYVEGHSLVIPSGNWEVVEGCSGVRYLIASVVVGSLYAYLNYRSLPRRLAFTAMAVICPIAANWLRAYGIVLLGHVSGNRLAAGVDHIVYGWVFFGLVMLALFWVGSRWQEDPLQAEQLRPFSRTSIIHPRRTLSWKSWSLGVCTVLLFSFWPWFLNVLLVPAERVLPDLATPVQSQGWARESGENFPFWSPRYSGMAANQQSVWTKEGRRIGLFVGYYRNQSPGGELINSENRVLQNKDPDWKYLGRGSLPALFGPKRVTVQTTSISGRVGRLQVWQLYWIGGWVTSNDYMGKAYLALNRLIGQGDDSAVVMAYTWMGDQGSEPANQVLEEYFRDMGPAIGAALVKTAEQ